MLSYPFLKILKGKFPFLYEELWPFLLIFILPNQFLPFCFLRIREPSLQLRFCWLLLELSFAGLLSHLSTMTSSAFTSLPRSSSRGTPNHLSGRCHLWNRGGSDSIRFLYPVELGFLMVGSGSMCSGGEISFVSMSLTKPRLSGRRFWSLFWTGGQYLALKLARERMWRRLLVRGAEGIWKLMSDCLTAILEE